VIVLKKRRNILLLVVVLTAAVVTPLVLLGVYVGYYVGDLVGFPRSILAILFSTVGFIGAIAILTKAIVKLVVRSSAS
jgi:hypothetical protein